MKTEKYICPCCGGDISGFVRESVIRYIRRRNTEKALAAQRRTPEMREAMNRSSAERLKKWREENPELASRLAEKAKNCRTAETFARQSETIKDTIRRKSLKFAELVFEAKTAGREITPELESELLDRARELVRAELKAERRAAKKKAKHADTV